MTPTCAHCGSPDVLWGEGRQTRVCRPCIAALGRIAGDPTEVNLGVIERLVAKHRDVVRLVVERGRGAWEWDRDWPDHRPFGKGW